MTEEQILFEKLVCSKCDDDITKNYIHCDTCKGFECFKLGATEATKELQAENEEQKKKAREMILKLYNAGRNVLMCYKLPRFEKEAYNRLSDCINNREVEKILKELE